MLTFIGLEVTTGRRTGFAFDLDLYKDMLEPHLRHIPNSTSYGDVSVVQVANSKGVSCPWATDLFLICCYVLCTAVAVWLAIC